MIEFRDQFPHHAFYDQVIATLAFSHFRGEAVQTDPEREYKVVAGIVWPEHRPEPSAILALGEVASRAIYCAFVEVMDLGWGSRRTVTIPDFQTAAYGRSGARLEEPEGAAQLLRPFRLSIAATDFNPTTTAKYAELLPDPANRLGVIVPDI